MKSIVNFINEVNTRITTKVRFYATTNASGNKGQLDSVSTYFKFMVYDSKLGSLFFYDNGEYLCDDLLDKPISSKSGDIVDDLENMGINTSLQLTNDLVVFKIK